MLLVSKYRVTICQYVRGFSRYGMAVLRVMFIFSDVRPCPS